MTGTHLHKRLVDGLGCNAKPDHRAVGRNEVFVRLRRQHVQLPVDATAATENAEEVPNERRVADERPHRLHARAEV